LCDKKVLHTAQLLMPAIPTPAFQNRGKGLKKVIDKYFLKCTPERAMPQKRELRTVARRDRHDLYKARTAIQFLTPDAP
jgi:hypothetical protein